ncbi:MAG: hypothetical protein FD152_1306 [Xanthobacteraceae bacterium]|jgi:hypothetical protein|nr:MAG: hypothetical protein FD152_1306 [Xanthobacteraceae bacterium]
MELLDAGRLPPANLSPADLARTNVVAAWKERSIAPDG